MSRSGDPPHRLGRRRALRHLWRALRLRCPNCGGRPLFRWWVRMRETCPRCHLRLDRGESDYFIGGYTINFVGAELFIALVALAAIVLTWPDVPWKAVEYGLYLVVVPFPVFTYPWAKTLWLALDLIFRPLTLSDLAGHGENLEDADGEDDPTRAQPEGRHGSSDPRST